MGSSLWHFFLHLRWHYQLGILSGCYLAGALFVVQLDVKTFWLQFLNVHLLLFAGATAFNSYWDKDEGPIGGLRNPPPMQGWMRNVSLIMQGLGWVWAWFVSYHFAMVYLVSMLLFWLYSTPLARWKSHPWLSMLAIAGSTGAGGFLMGYLAAGGMLRMSLIWQVLGVSCILLSLYPISQIFQISEDNSRGDQTFAVRFGISGVKNFFMFSYLAGISLLSIGFYSIEPLLAGFFLALSGLAGLLDWVYFTTLSGSPSEYSTVMRIKWITSLLFILFLLVCYVHIHVVQPTTGVGKLANFHHLHTFFTYYFYI